MLLLVPFTLLPVLGSVANMGSIVAIPMVTLPWAARLTWLIYRRPPDRWLNGLLAETALLELAFALSLAASLVLPRTH